MELPLHMQQTCCIRMHFHSLDQSLLHLALLRKMPTKTASNERHHGLVDKYTSRGLIGKEAN